VAISQLPTAEQEYFEQSLNLNEASTSHIYFKDLKLLAHDEDSEEEEHEEGGLEGEARLQGGAAGPLQREPSLAMPRLERLNSGGRAAGGRQPCSSLGMTPPRCGEADACSVTCCTVVYPLWQRCPHRRLKHLPPVQCGAVAARGARSASTARS
jgi:hypothetical protein